MMHRRRRIHRGLSSSPIGSPITSSIISPAGDGGGSGPAPPVGGAAQLILNSAPATQFTFYYGWMG